MSTEAVAIQPLQDELALASRATQTPFELIEGGANAEATETAMVAHLSTATSAVETTETATEPSEIPFEREIHDDERSVGFFRNAFDKVSDKMHTAKRFIATYSSVGAGLLGGTAGVQLITAGESVAKSPDIPTAKASAGSTTMPDAYAVVKDAQAKAFAAFPDLKAQYFNATYEDKSARQIQNQIKAGVVQRDEIKKIQVSKKGNKYNVKLTQDNARAMIVYANYHLEPQYNTPLWNKTLELDVDSDIFDEKVVTLTPALKDAHKTKFHDIGKTVTMKNLDNTNSEDLVQYVVNASDTAHDASLSSKASLAPNKLKSTMVKAGRFFVKLSTYCNLRNPAYDPKNRKCDEVIGSYLRVNPNGTTTYYGEQGGKKGAIVKFSHKKR